MAGKRFLALGLLALACETQVPPDPTPSILVDEGDFIMTGVDSAGRIYGLISDYYYSYGDELVRYTDTSREVFLEDAECFHVKGNLLAAYGQHTLLLYDLRTDSLLVSTDPGFSPEIVAIVDTARVLVVNDDSFLLWDVKGGGINYLFGYYWEDMDDPYDYYYYRSLDVSWPLIILDDGELLDSTGKVLEDRGALGHDFVFWPGADSLLVFCSSQYPGYLGRLNRNTGQVIYYDNKVSGLSDARVPSVSPRNDIIVFGGNHGDREYDYWMMNAEYSYPTAYYLWKYPIR